MQAYYICLLVVLVGSLAEGRWFDLREGNDDLERVKKVVSAANEFLEKTSSGEISTRGLSYDYFFGSGSIKNGRIGKLSTLYASGENQYLNKTTLDVTVFYYDIWVGLEKFYISHDFQFKFFHFIEGSGHTEILAKNNVFRLTGAVTKRADSCSGVLQKAVLTQLSGFKVTITPSTVANSLLATVMEFATHYVLPSGVPTFNEFIADQSEGESFKKIFSEIACQSINKL